MHQKTTQIVKGAGSYFISTAITSLGTFIVSMIIAWHFGKEGLGIFSVVLTAVLLGVVLSELGLNPYIVREFPSGERTVALNFSTVIVLRSVAAIVAAIVLSALTVVVSPQVSSLGLVSGTAIFIVSRSVGSGIENLIKAQRRHVTFFVFTLSSTLLQISVALAGAVLLLTLEELILLLAFVDILKLVVLFYLCRLEIGKPSSTAQFSRDTLRTVFFQCIPFMSIGIFSLLTERADILLLAHLRNAAEAGVYSAADRFLVLVAFIDASVFASTLPVLHSIKAKGERYTITNQLLFVGFAISVLLSVGFYWGAPLLIRSTFRFSESISLLQLLAFAFPAMIASRTLRTVLYTGHRERIVAWIMAGSCGLTIALNVVFIPVYGAMAAAMITVVSEYLAAFSFAVIYFRHERADA